MWAPKTPTSSERKGRRPVGSAREKDWSVLEIGAETNTVYLIVLPMQLYLAALGVANSPNACLFILPHSSLM